MSVRGWLAWIASAVRPRAVSEEPMPVAGAKEFRISRVEAMGARGV